MRLIKKLIVFFIVNSMLIASENYEENQYISEWLGNKSKNKKEKQKIIPYIQFKDIKLENLFDYLSSRYDVNIVLEEPMLRFYTTSLRLKNTTIEEVIKIVVKEYNLHFIKKNKTYYISTRLKYHTENYNAQEYITEHIKIQYASVTDITMLLKDIMQGTAVIRTTAENKPYSGLFDATPKLMEGKEIEDSGDSSIVPENENVSLSSDSVNIDDKIIKDGIMLKEYDDSVPKSIIYIVPFLNENMIYLISQNQNLIDKAKKHIKEVDQPIKEVLIQGKIINVNIGDEFESAFDFISKSSDVATPSANSIVNMGNVQYTFLDSLTSTNIKILQRDGKAKTMASPMLLTANRNKATLNLTEELSIIKGWTAGTVTQVDGGGAVTTPSTPVYATENIGTMFEIVPFINTGGEILLKIRITISTLKPKSQQMLVPNGTGGFDNKTFDAISKTSIDTTLVTKNGRGIVLGGLINEIIEKQEDKVPLLGDIPGLGFFFKEITDVTKKSETVVVLTPYLVDIKKHNSHEMMDSVRNDIEKDHNLLKDDEAKLDSTKIIDNVLDKDTLEIKKELKLDNEK